MAGPVRLVLLLTCCCVDLPPHRDERSNATSASADVKVSDEARRQFRAGVQLMEDPGGPRWEEAYRAFKAAFRASPSPKILGNLGLCAMKLERDGEAIAAYKRYLAEVGAVAPAERKVVAADLDVDRVAQRRHAHDSH